MSNPRPSRLLLLGASGQVGSELLPRLLRFGEVSAPSHAQLDLASEDSIRAAVRTLRPAVIINAAAYTAVDRAESDRESALRVNAVAPGILAEEAQRCRALLVHYSTDYVFDGKSRVPYREDDATGPLNEYGRTKLLGEQRVAAAGGAYLILRTGWVYACHGRNFLLTMLRLGAEQEELRVVDDQVGTPTPAFAVAEATLAALAHYRLESDLYDHACRLAGIYHVGCSGQTSWYGFAQAIFEQEQKDSGSARFKTPRVVPITTEEYPTPAQRPRYSVLAKDKAARTFGLQAAPWKEQLARVVRQLAHGVSEVS